MSAHNFTLNFKSGEDVTGVTFYADSREMLRENLKTASSILMEKVYPVDYAAEFEKQAKELAA